MGFESVDKNKYRNKPPELRIHKSSTGTGYLTSCAMREFFKHTDAVDILVDTDAKKIAFDRSPDENAETWKLSGAGEGSRGADVHIKGALHDLGIHIDEVDRTWEFKLEYDRDHELIVADLREFVETYISRRRCSECGRVCDSTNALRLHIRTNHDEKHHQSVATRGGGD